MSGPKPKKPKLEKPKPIDYVFMIGGPLVFLAIAVLGLRALMGPEPTIPPIDRLRNGSVVAGMTANEVIKIAGTPKAIVHDESGRLSYRYMNGSWDVRKGTFVEEDAYVDFAPNGVVSGVTFESRTPSPPK